MEEEAEWESDGLVEEEEKEIKSGRQQVFSLEEPGSKEESVSENET